MDGLERTVSRRGALRLLIGGGTAALIAACSSPSPTASPTAAPAAPTAAAAAKPAAPSVAVSTPASGGAPTSAPAAGAATRPPAGTAAPAAAAAGAGTPKMGGTLKALAGGSRITLAMGYDPALNNGARAEALMFEGLTKVQDDFSIAPGLATSWTISPDNLTYTFKMRPAVKFHNGRVMDATDAKYSLERVMDPATLSPSRLLYANVDHVDAPDPGTVVITLKQPYAPLLALLADDAGSIVPKEEVAKGNFGLKPIGTGPFKFVSHVVDQQIILERHPDYWDPGFPRLDRLEVTDVLNLQADFLRFKSGQYDVFLEGPEDQFSDIKSQFPVVVTNDTNWVYFRFNRMKVPQFADPRVIQAISWAIDRDQLAGFSLPPELAVPNGGSGAMVAWAAPKQPWAYPQQDLNKAQQLLKDAGVPSGFKFEIQTMASVAYLPKSIQVVQQMLSQIGMNVTTTVLERAPTTAQLPQIDSYLGGSTGGYDPDFEMTQWFTPGGASNPYGFSDDQVTQTLAQARATLDQNQRGDLYRQAQSRAAQVSNTLFLYNNNKFNVAYPYVQGFVYPGPAEHRWLEAKQIWLNK